MIRFGSAILAGAAALAVSVGSQAAQKTAPFTWNCPQTLSGGITPVIPVRTTVNLRATIANPSNPEHLVFDTTELRNLLGPYDAGSPQFRAGGPDYHECVRSAVENAEIDAWQSCSEMLTAANWPTPANSSTAALKTAGDARNAWCQDESVRSVSAFRKYAVELSTAAEARGALPALKPMTPIDAMGISPVPDQAAREAIRDRMAKHCGTKVTPTFGMDNQSAFAVALSSDFVRDQLPSVMARTDVSQGCKDRLMASYISELAAAYPPPSACPSGSTAAPCVDARRRAGELFDQLRQWLPATGSERAEVDRLVACIRAGQNEFENIAFLGTEVRQIHSCQPVPAPPSPDSSRVINERDVGTSIAAEYKLQNRGSGVFRAELNVTFDAGLAAGLAASDFSSRTTTQVNQCLNTYKDQLKGPSGERIEIVLGNPSGPPPAPPITIEFDQRAEARANAQVWSGSMVTTLPGSTQTAPDCPVILHELLHRLGLIDEYEETAIGHHVDPSTGGLISGETGAVGAYTSADCRSRGPEDSIMSNHIAAIDRASGRYSALSCSCGGLPSRELETCRAGVAGMAESATECPRYAAGSSLASLPASPPPTAPQLTAYNNATPGLSADGNTRTVRSHVAPRSLLHPAHFRAITQPGCASANRGLYTCSRSAYATSRAHGGDGCPRLPAVCGTEAWLQ